MAKSRFQVQTVVRDESRTATRRLFHDGRIIDFQRVSSRRSHFEFRMERDFSSYLDSMPLFNLFSLFEEGFFVVGLGKGSPDFALSSHRCHHSMLIRYQGEPGIDVERFWLIQWYVFDETADWASMKGYCSRRRNCLKRFQSTVWFSVDVDERNNAPDNGYFLLSGLRF